ncbi:MAG: hypothetical protein MJ234_01505 [bacterium]|nr:hypothetical protein [bacterium]
MALRVPKEKVPVILLTSSYRVEGELHVVPGGRLIDEINKKDRDFIPVTNATIYEIAGDAPLDSLDFIAINKTQVVMIAPSVSI